MRGARFGRTIWANDGAHRPPSPDWSKLQNSKAPVPRANGGSVQRSGSAIQASSTQKSPANTDQPVVMAGQSTRWEMYPRNTPNTRKESAYSAWSAVKESQLQQQEVTEKTEGRSGLCSLLCLLFKTLPGNREWTPMHANAA